MKTVCLIQPPATKPTEPPLSLAVLLAHLRQNGVPASALDANLDACLYLLREDVLASAAGHQPSTRVRRALKHRSAALDYLRSSAAANSFARYATAVRYLDDLLALHGAQSGVERLTLGDYQHRQLSPFAPADLAALARGERSTLFADYFRRELLPRIHASGAQLVAIGIQYLNQVLPAFELAGLLRSESPDLELVAGGGLLTSWKATLRELDLRLPPFDRLVFGPGEAPLLALAQAAAGDAYFLEDHRQTSFVPDFDFASLADYLSPETILPLATSRGCYWEKCRFCPEAATPVHPFIGAGPGDIPVLLQGLATAHRVRHFHLTDNAIPVNQLEMLAAAEARLVGLNWYGFVRFEPALEDAGFVRRLAASGCRMLQLGLESGSQTVLDRLGKGIRLAAVRSILANLQAAGIASYVYVMLGTPGETAADAELTRTFLLEQAARIDYLNISIMNLPRGSKLLKTPEEHGIVSSELLGESAPLGLYRSFAVTGDWDRKAARRFVDQRLLGEPAIRAIVQRTPPWMTSNHAHFFARSSG